MSPYNPWTALSPDKFKVIGMDQRFANVPRTTGGSVKATDGWDTFLADQVALLDHLKIKQCHLVGSCIGPSYAFNLLKHYPQRFGRCVMLQPIGLAHHTTEPIGWYVMNVDATWSWVGDWGHERIASKLYPGEEMFPDLKGLHDRMFQNGNDFVFSISKDEATKIQTPLLVFMGRDKNHPAETARQICRLCPNAELVETWRDAGDGPLAEAANRIDQFLSVDLSKLEQADNSSSKVPAAKRRRKNALP